MPYYPPPASGGSGGVSDGDKGDITVSSSGAVWTVDNDVVTFVKMQNVATDRLVGRDTASSGDPEELTVSGGIEFTGSGGIQRSALTGDVTASAGSNATTIANDAVTYAKIQNVSATDKLLGRSTAGAGDIEEITCTAAGRALIDDANATAQLATLGAEASLGNPSTSGYILQSTGAGVRSWVVSPKRQALLVTAQGLISEPYPRGNINTQSTVTSGKIQGSLVGLLVGDVITNILFIQQSNGSSLTLAKVGLYNTSGTLLASSADISSSLTSGAGTQRSFALSSPYTITTEGGYYRAFIIVGTTPPSIFRGTNNAGMSAVGSGSAPYVSQTSQTDLPSPATFSQDSVAFWIACS